MAAPGKALAAKTQSTPLLAIVVGFDGGGKAALASPYDDGYDWAASIFGTDGEGALAAYYRELSGGTFTFSPAAESCAFTGKAGENRAERANDGVVHVTLEGEHGRWGLVNADADIAQEFGKVVIEAFDVASGFVDYESYDTSGDGIITPDELAVVFVIAGYDASPFEKPDRTDIPVMWPHAGKLASGYSSSSDQNVKLDSYIALAERFTFDAGKPKTVSQEPIGILYHELGHYLGLPDLYPTNKNAEDGTWGAYRVGMLSLMDNGGWAQAPGSDPDGGPVYAPTAFDAWSRYLLGWTYPKIVTESGDYKLKSQQAKGGYTSLLIPTSDPDQLYLVENRQAVGLDAGLAGAYGEDGARGGIVIWHVNKAAYRMHGAENEQNDTDHAPALMELFYEAAGDAYSTDWSHSMPLADGPFYDALSCEAKFGDAGFELSLPLYAGEPSSPADRRDSGIRLSFPSSSGQNMQLHVEMGSAKAGNASQAYPLDENELYALRTGRGALGAIACAALARETDADVAVVRAKDVHDGLPAGEIDYSDVYAALPADENIVLFEMSGAQLIELAEQSLNVSDPYRRFIGVLDALRQFSFGSRVPAVEDLAPDADGALMFGGLSLDVDWKGLPGVRTSNATVGGEPIEPNAIYRVATTQGAAAEYETLARLNRDTSVLWGSPADALRSYIQTENWEETG